jgi:DNA repair exonuclease SbcCD ATPase subunit|uniref:Intron-binding protein aquarius N-terminus n=2 Tax=unclassified Caudoviricetes TaxID=2788787 RepID=A0A8S5M3I2_9CAUD|nr:MAG TPA: Intron-binding protein aquarius N-terminus [Siphoviridae sp. ctQJR51]DAD76729.1 MAG TPA: Intron-binding protein aquarius N-terminus [Siphoviridae sp. ctQJR51]DAF96536.1 MAG TPA: Intron-binding protein aquarius N-terminus [Siphoviridae sp. ctHj524]DAF96561.1 MAG TPA: Intron-binding protein aquarius N-terminus [Siphoviridae sp. ctHj524]
MTIDELTVKITVAAEEAEAALDALLEKVRAFQEKTGLALQLDAGSWDSQLAETGEGFQQAGEQAEALADKLRQSTETALAHKGAFEELGGEAQKIREGFQQNEKSVQGLVRQLAELGRQREALNQLKNLSAQLKNCEKGGEGYRKTLTQIQPVLKKAGISTENLGKGMEGLDDAVTSAEKSMGSAANGIAGKLEGVIRWAEQTKQSLTISGSVNVDTSPSIQALNGLIAVAQTALALLNALGLGGGTGKSGGGGGGGGGGNKAEEAEKKAEEARKKALQADYDRIEHRRHLNEISLEEELAGLEEIRRKHQMTAEEIMAWEEKVYDLKKEIRERDADSIDQLADGVVSALEKRYEAMRDAEIERLDKSREAWEQWRDDSVAAIEDQIAALDKLADTEDEEKKSAEELRKIEKLRREVEYEQDAYNRQKLQQQLDEAVASREERLRKLELKQQKEALQEEIEKIRDQASEKIKELDGEQDAIEKAYEERLKAASLQAEAEKLLMTKSQDEIMDLLYEYVPEYDALGKSMGEKLLEGFQSKVGSITDWFRGFNDQLARMQENLAGSMNAATDRFYESRRDTASQSGQSGATMVQQTVNFYEPVESPGQVARRMEDVNDQLGWMMA